MTETLSHVTQGILFKKEVHRDVPPTPPPAIRTVSPLGDHEQAFHIEQFKVTHSWSWALQLISSVTSPRLLSISALAVYSAKCEKGFGQQYHLDYGRTPQQMMAHPQNNIHWGQCRRADTTK